MTKDLWNQSADSYDSESWHRESARHAIGWVTPKAGDRVLDLACGTGNYSLLASKTVGPSGIVIGVDFSTNMLDRLKQRKALAKQEHRNILTVDHDITDLASSKIVSLISKRDGGFDIITCLATLDLLKTRKERRLALRSWASFLKPGGRMIIEGPQGGADVPALIGRLAIAVMPTNDSKHMKEPADLPTLEKMVKDAGLEVVKAFVTPSYNGEMPYRREHADFLLADPDNDYNGWNGHELKKKYGKGRVERAWKKVYYDALDEDGIFMDGFRRLVVIGQKPKGDGPTGRVQGADSTRGPSLPSRGARGGSGGNASKASRSSGAGPS